MPSQQQSPKSSKGTIVAINTKGSTKAPPQSLLQPIQENTVGISKNLGRGGERWVMKPVEYDSDGETDLFAFEIVVQK
ncbi:hypothetical protein TWF281_006517 [Arthrobotrys megalospora]